LPRLGFPNVRQFRARFPLFRRFFARLLPHLDPGFGISPATLGIIALLSCFCHGPSSRAASARTDSTVLMKWRSVERFTPMKLAIPISQRIGHGFTRAIIVVGASTCSSSF
jgi:hypothetical protein